MNDTKDATPKRQETHSAARREKSVTELCADNQNLREYIAQLEGERDVLAAVGSKALGIAAMVDA